MGKRWLNEIHDGPSTVLFVYCEENCVVLCSNKYVQAKLSKIAVFCCMVPGAMNNTSS
jgi:hypothetical protein